jgi:hypothetical protein
MVPPITRSPSSRVEREFQPLTVLLPAMPDLNQRSAPSGAAAACRYQRGMIGGFTTRAWDVALIFGRVYCNPLRESTPHHAAVPVPRPQG